MKFLQIILLFLLAGSFGFVAAETENVKPENAEEPVPVSIFDKEDPVNTSVLDKNEDKFEESSIRIFGFTALIGLAGYGYIWWQRKRGTGPDSSIRIVAVKPLGQREKVAVLEILGEKMVVGITAHHVSLLRRDPGSFTEEIGEAGQKQ